MSPRYYRLVLEACWRAKKHGSSLVAARDYPRAHVEIAAFDEFPYWLRRRKGD